MGLGNEHGKVATSALPVLVPALVDETQEETPVMLTEGLGEAGDESLGAVLGPAHSGCPALVEETPVEETPVEEETPVTLGEALGLGESLARAVEETPVVEGTRVVEGYPVVEETPVTLGDALVT
jgi:hypothetical protein